MFLFKKFFWDLPPTQPKSYNFQMQTKSHFTINITDKSKICIFISTSGNGY